MSDPYAAARKHERGVLEYYIAGLTAIGGAFFAGLSFALLPDLSGPFLWAAIACAVAAAAALLFGLWTVVDVLRGHPFDPTALADPAFKEKVTPFEPILLPPDITSLSGIDDRIEALVAKRPQTEGIVADIDRLTQAKVAYYGFAELIALRDRVEPAKRRLLVVFGIVFALAAAATVLHGIGKEDPDRRVPVTLSLTGGWAGYVSALSAACPMPYPDALTATGKQNSPMQGWWTVTLTGAPCEGVTVSLPARMVLTP
ncbi:hypothetical protein [Jannaschia marina]|uniref:hypothetical protein n=1 Tax=Jannaschia marina TaxID=2741674 RepID=UPI0015CACD5B|nr:hypothetical protein [Jannaschia marina]